MDVVPILSSVWFNPRRRIVCVFLNFSVILSFSWPTFFPFLKCVAWKRGPFNEAFESYKI